MEAGEIKLALQTASEDIIKSSNTNVDLSDRQTFEESYFHLVLLLFLVFMAKKNSSTM